MIDSTAFSKFYHTFDNITFVHAASHPAIWETDPKIGKTEKSRFIVGETVNEIDEDGYPVRLYNWIEEIPAGKTVVVGHDRKPIRNVAITSPMTVPNKNGGKAIFLDTGCGKGGFLSGVVVMADKTKKFNIVTYVDFSQPEQKS
jgi:protein phosphatase